MLAGLPKFRGGNDEGTNTRSDIIFFSKIVTINRSIGTVYKPVPIKKPMVTVKYQLE